MNYHWNIELKSLTVRRKYPVCILRVLCVFDIQENLTKFLFLLLPFLSLIVEISFLHLQDKVDIAVKRKSDTHDHLLLFFSRKELDKYSDVIANSLNHISD